MKGGHVPIIVPGTSTTGSLSAAKNAEIGNTKLLPRIRFHFILRFYIIANLDVS